MFDAKIVAACIQARSAFDIVANHVDVDEFTPTGKFWWKLVERWYGNDPLASAIDKDTFRGIAEREGGRNSAMALEWLDLLPSLSSPDNAAVELLSLKQMVAYRKLAAAIEEEWDRDEIIKLADAHHDLLHATSLRTDRIEWLNSDEDMLASLDPSTKIPLYPTRLSDKCEGGAERGSFIVLFGPVESGKTLVAINMTGGWLRKGFRVLYLGNEEPLRRTKLRLVTNLAGMNKEEVAADPQKAMALARRRGWANFKAAQIFPGTVDTVDAAIKEFKPDCVVVDQMRNLQGGTAKNGTRAQSLDRIAVDLRQLFTRHNVVGLGLGQAHAQEHGRAPKIYHDATDFDESRVGVPAQADLLLALGYDAAMYAHNQRAMALCKNKLSGDHEGFLVTLDIKRSRVV